MELCPELWNIFIHTAFYRDLVEKLVQVPIKKNSLDGTSVCAPLLIKALESRSFSSIDATHS